MNARIVRLQLNDEYEVGLTFADAVGGDAPVQIAAIEPGSEAEGLLSVGEVVLSINGNPTFGKKKGYAATAVADVYEGDDGAAPVVLMSVAGYYLHTKLG